MHMEALKQTRSRLFKRDQKSNSGTFSCQANGKKCKSGAVLGIEALLRVVEVSPRCVNTSLCLSIYISHIVVPHVSVVFESPYGNLLTLDTDLWSLDLWA